MQKLWIIVALIFASKFSHCKAAEITTDKLDGGTPLIMIEGDIEIGDDKRFNDIAARTSEAIVMLSSNGGNVSAAIGIGQAIRLKSYSTVVINGSPCNSACALIWLAGSPRFLTKTARIGFHAVYRHVGNNDEETGVGNAIVGRYLTLLNLPERAVLFATTASPSRLNFLSPENLDSSGIEAKVISDFNADKAAKQTSPSNTVAQSRENDKPTNWGSVGSWKIMVDPTIGRGCFMMASWNGGTVLRLGFKPMEKLSSYLMLGNQAWASLRAGSNYKIQLRFDDNDPWNLDSKVIVVGGGNFLSQTFTQPQFWTEFKGAKGLTVIYNGRPIDKLALADSGAAYVEMQRCQNSQPKYSVDPFAN